MRLRLTFCLALLGCAGVLGAQDLLNMKGLDRPAPLKDVGIDQKLDSQIPLDATFRDEAGRTVKLGEYFGKRPVIMALVYYQCPMLCNRVLDGLVSALRILSFDPGQEFDVVVVSFDAREQPPLAQAKKEAYLKAYGRPQTSGGWHFLTGDLNSIHALTKSVGFRYTWDAHSNQFAHASAIIEITPQGRVSSYYYGVEFPPKDMRLGLIQASQNKIGSPVDQILLFCFHYDPTTGRYTPVAMNILRLAGGATLLLLGGFVFVMLRRDSNEGQRAA